ncbi:MAG: protein kinase [Chloroflexota bacterium]
MDDLSSLIGQTFGQYKIVEQVGAGGMAAVFKAHQSSLNREVALKILPPQVAQRSGFTERFVRESQAIANLHHPNILPVYDSGQDKGYGYLAMRYIPQALTLADLMRDQLTVEHINELLDQLAKALDHAHKAGIVHRDVKPSNVLMDGDWVLLSDFGLAKATESDSQLTGTGVSVGTPAYMSPEQARGEKIDHRTDIYALGVILFQMLTNEIPHKAQTPIATVAKRISEPPPSPRSIKPDISKSVERVVMKALAPQPDDRYYSAADLATAFRQASTQQERYPTIGSITPQEQRLAALQSEQIKSHTAQAATAAGTVPAALPSNRVSSIEVVFMTLLGVGSFCGIIGSLLGLTPNDQGQLNIAMTPACLGMSIAGIGAIAMIWLRNRSRPASVWVGLGIVAWLIGMSILGFGGFAVLSPGDNTAAENLGFSLALCFAPGGLLTLLGLLAYGYDHYRGQKEQAVAPVYTASTPPQAETELEAKLRRAKEYREHISELITRQKKGAFAQQLGPVTAKLDLWETHLHQLADRLQKFEGNRLIQQDLQNVPVNISKLEKRLEEETNTAVRAQISETLVESKKHGEELKSLTNLMRRTDLEIDETLATIGTIYSQLQILGAKEIDSSRADRLSEDIGEQANRLSDLLSAMDEVYDQTDNF